MQAEKPTSIAGDAAVAENELTANWRCFNAGHDARGMVEVPIYTDADISSDNVEVGPYLFLNALAFAGRRGRMRQAIIVRIGFYRPESPFHDVMKAGAEHYHGGNVYDELAALVSLLLGIRTQAGEVDREFREHSDSRGRPIRFGLRREPHYAAADAPQIPAALGNRSLDLLRSMSLVHRSPAETNTIVKVARLYQQAMWIADADPALAWLLFVSAVEAAAATWDAAEMPAEDRLQRWMPPLYDLLSQSAPQLIPEVAGILAQRTRATRKFIDFIVRFAPPPPQPRPSEFLQFSFESNALKVAAEVIYGHRSNALHNGIGFPRPMCDAAQRMQFEARLDDGYQEIPLGLASSAFGASWDISETPMLLQTFEYIARNAILNWWNSLSE